MSVPVESFHNDYAAEPPALKRELDFRAIASNRYLTVDRKASHIASGLMDNACITYGIERSALPNEAYFLTMYPEADALAQNGSEDDVAIVIEIMDEALHDPDQTPPLYADILHQAESLAKLVTVGRPAQTAEMMIRLWAVFETEVELPALFTKIKQRAHQRNVRTIHVGGFGI
ncbi:MAG: hypothetical protein U0520_05330 [Candidatus Saccharimonadales bacterium]